MMESVLKWLYVSFLMRTGLRNMMPDIQPMKAGIMQSEWLRDCFLSYIQNAMLIPSESFRQEKQLRRNAMSTVNDLQDKPEGLDVSVCPQAPFPVYLWHSIHLRGDPKAPLAD